MYLIIALALTSLPDAVDSFVVVGVAAPGRWPTRVVEWPERSR